MAQNQATLRQLVYRVKPWVGVAVILAVVLLGYLLVQGWRYWQASGDVSSLSQEILKFETSTKLMVLQGEQSEAELESQPLEGQRTVDELESIFSHRSAESLMTIVAATALEAPVELTTINPGPPQIKVIGELQYRTQPISISVGGTTDELFRFLSLIHENVPVVSVSDLSIGGLGGSPQAQMLLLFYLSPEPIEVEEEIG